MMEIKTNREFKDRVFRDLFGSEERKEYALSLYNALAGTSHEDPAELQLTTLDNVLYMNVRNDVSFLIGSEMVLWEHQSTWNPNMPLRGLEYFGKLYSKLVEPMRGKLYTRSRLKLPTPRYVVLYNGPAKDLERRELRLSDSYEGEGDVEVVAHVVNVNADSGEPALERCEALSGYAELVAMIRELSATMPLEEAVDGAIDRCIAQGILVEYLTSRRAEVKVMFMEELSEEEIHSIYRERGREEGFEEGREEGREQGLEEGREQNLVASIRSLVKTTGWSSEQAMDALEVPEAERARILGLLEG